MRERRPTELSPLRPAAGAARGIGHPLRTAAVLTVLALLVLGVRPGVGPDTLSARADTAPPTGTPATVSADPLPTVQINGVVWSQVTIGTTVYATGNFSSARPAGSPTGTNETPRANLLAYDIRTGTLNTSFHHTLNAQGLTLAASPDGTRLYVGGDFTTIDSQPRNRIAAFDTTTGTLIADFHPTVTNRVRALAATNTTVYVGGNFFSVNGVGRTRLAAVAANSGALLSWAPKADDGEVSAMVLAPGGSAVVAGGHFTTVSAAAAYGLAMLDASSGALRPFAAGSVVRDGGANAGITSLRTDGRYIIGTGYVFGAGGNLEGAFAADPAAGGKLIWLEDCKGDTYDSYTSGQVSYVVSHEHKCDTVGAFPQSPTPSFQRSTAFTNYATGTVAHSPAPSDMGGKPAPTQLTWYPTLSMGSFTGQSQAAWSATGTGDYIALGGEFPRVNGTSQQGLVRFALKASAPNKAGPAVSSSLNPTVSSLEAGSARIGWTATADPDNAALTYSVLRDGVTVSSRTVSAPFWALPRLGYADSGLTPGSTHSYRIVASDPSGNKVSGTSTTVTVSTAKPSAYAQRVRADGASSLWRLGERSGSRGYDSASYDDLTLQSGTTRGVSGAIVGESDTATTFNGTTTGSASSSVAASGPTTFTTEAWVRTRSTSGGKILGFASSQTGLSRGYDRQLYLDNAGHLIFGIYDGATRTVASPGTYNDGRWHQVAGTVSAAGMTLYVDGVRVAGSTYHTTQSYVGYWRIGGDNLSSWPSQPSSMYLAGDIDEVAIYPSALSSGTVAAHFQAGTAAQTVAPAETPTPTPTATPTPTPTSTATPTPPPPPPPLNQAPTAAFTATATDLAVAFDGAGSKDADGTIASYAWAFGDAATATGAEVSHTYAKAGTYTATLTVTDNAGATGSATRQVSVTAAAPAPAPAPAAIALDSFARTVTGGLGTADKGGAWTVTGTTSRYGVAGGVASLNMSGPGVQDSAYLAGVSSSDADSTMTLSTDKVADGSVFLSVVGRRVAANTEYRGKIRILPNQTVSLSFSRLAGTSTETGFGPSATVPGLTYTAGSELRVRLQVTGTSPTTLRLKLWPAADPEPAAWALTTTDSTAGLQAAGATGVTTYLSSSATTGATALQIRDYAVNPTG